MKSSCFLSSMALHGLIGHMWLFLSLFLFMYFCTFDPSKSFIDAFACLLPCALFSVLGHSRLALIRCLVYYFLHGATSSGMISSKLISVSSYKYLEYVFIRRTRHNKPSGLKHAKCEALRFHSRLPTCRILVLVSP